MDRLGDDLDDDFVPDELVAYGDEYHEEGACSDVLGDNQGFLSGEEDAGDPEVDSEHKETLTEKKRKRREKEKERKAKVRLRLAFHHRISHEYLHQSRRENWHRPWMSSNPLQ